MQNTKPEDNKKLKSEPSYFDLETIKVIEKMTYKDLKKIFNFICDLSQAIYVYQIKQSRNNLFNPNSNCSKKAV